MNKLFCPVAARCGGCQYTQIPYREQLAQKQAKIESLFPGVKEISPIEGMANPYYYRCKVQAVFGIQKGEIVSGTYEAGTHRLVPVKTCLLEQPAADAILHTIRRLMKEFKLRPYHEDSGRGLLRHVLIRCGYATGQILVVLVTGREPFRGKQHFIRALRLAHPEITTVIHSINDKKTSMVLGMQNKVIYGPGFIYDTLLGLSFRISAQSFYQVNPPQAEKLYTFALEMANLSGQESLLDAYCGTGTIGLIAADRVKQVTGVEINREAVKDAVLNAKMNHIQNARFVCQDAGQYLQKEAARGRVPQVVIMDPPRSGSDKAFLQALAATGPRSIVYISCNPVTQARDAAYLTAHGYCIKKAQPVDLFPMTDHIENIIVMKKKV